MKRLLSKYHLKFPRSLVYMLQASEYAAEDFFDWYRKVRDFRHVEERKALVKTPKAFLLLALGYFFYFGLILNAVLSAVFYDSLSTFVVIGVLLPYITLYLLVLSTFAINYIQKPIEKRIVSRAQEKLALHKGLKIAIAGSFGKTTMKEMLKTVLSEKKNVAATPANKNTPLGISRFVESLDGKEEVLIFEMGEYYPGDIKELCELVDPNVGIITGVNEAHLSKFKNLESTTGTIFELADFLKDRGRSNLYVNAESRLAKEHAAKYEAILYGASGIESKSGNMTADLEETDLSGVRFVLKNNKGEGVVVNSKLLGLHQVGPLSCVAHIAGSLGMKTEDIELGIKKTAPFEHRLESREIDGGVTVIDDSYNGNPDGARVAINFLKNITGKRRFYVTPGLVEMGEKTEEVHKAIGHRLAEANIEKIVLIKNSVTPIIEEGLKEKNYKGEIIWFDSSKECFASLPRLTVSNDLLLYQNDWPDNYS